MRRLCGISTAVRLARSAEPRPHATTHSGGAVAGPAQAGRRPLAAPRILRRARSPVSSQKARARARADGRSPDNAGRRRPVYDLPHDLWRPTKPRHHNWDVPGQARATPRPGQPSHPTRGRGRRSARLEAAARARLFALDNVPAASAAWRVVAGDAPRPAVEGTEHPWTTWTGRSSAHRRDDGWRALAASSRGERRDVLVHGRDEGRDRRHRRRGHRRRRPGRVRSTGGHGQTRRPSGKLEGRSARAEQQGRRLVN